MSSDILEAEVFFLPRIDRPSDLQDSEDNHNSRFWHCGVICNGRVYETFENSRHMISPLSRLNHPEFRRSKKFSITVIKKFLFGKLRSGITCEKYVLSSMGVLKDFTIKHPIYTIDDVFEEIKDNYSLV